MDTIRNIQDKIAPVCRQYGIDKVFLFGSYVRGEATEQSDIDLRVDIGKKLPDSMQIWKMHLGTELTS